MALAGVPRDSSAAVAVRVSGTFTPEEIDGFKSLAQIVAFLNIPAPIAASFYEAMGAAADTMPRALGVIELEELKGMVKDLQIPEPVPEGSDPTKRALTIGAWQPYFIMQGLSPLRWH